MRATAIVEPAIRGVASYVRSPRDFDAVDEFASSVAVCLGQHVPVLEATLPDAPADGYLLVFGDRDLSGYDRQWSRIVFIGADRATAAKKVEEFGLAAAIEKHRYFQWKTQRSREHGLGLIGLREVAARSSARVVEGPYSTANYGCLSSPLIPDLPALLASYLEVLETLQGTA